LSDFTKKYVNISTQLTYDNIFVGLTNHSVADD